jgi:hypothetical protein
MRSAFVITGIFAVSLATAPTVRAQDGNGKRAATAAPAPPAVRALAVPRAEPRPMPSAAAAGAATAQERAGMRRMPRETAAPPRMSVPRSEPAQASGPPPVRLAAPMFAAPPSNRVSEAREQGARTRSAPRDSGGGGRAQAVPRGERRAPDSGRAEPASAAPRGERRAAAGDSSSGSGPARAVPRGERPSDGRYPVGQAAVRTRYPYSSGYYPRNVWYYRAPYYGYGALGLGYFYYDPFWAGYAYAPYGYAPYGYYGGGYYGSPGYYGGGYHGGSYGVGVGYGSGGGGSGYYGTGHLKLKVRPRDAEVYVDGYYAGLVDDYDGVFQKLELEAGPHRIEVRKAGFATMTFEVRVPADESVTYRGEMNPL